MVIPYLKETGTIKTPVMTSDVPLTLIDILGEEEGIIYSKICDVINIKDDLNILYNIRDYYVDIETKELKKKPEVIKSQSIMYL